jgi:acyl carrier protein
MEIVNYVISKRGHEGVSDESLATRDANFRSLDFSEVALRIENEIGRELAFDAATMRRIETIKDVLDFFESAANN